MSSLSAKYEEKFDDHKGSQISSSRISYAPESVSSSLTYNCKQKIPSCYQTQLQNITSAGVEDTIRNCITSSQKQDIHTNDSYNEKQNSPTKSTGLIDDYDDIISSFLPPPSPAPTTDHFVMGIVTPLQTPVASSAASQNQFNNYERAAINRKTSKLRSVGSSQSSLCSMSNVSLGNGNMNGSHQFQQIHSTPSSHTDLPNTVGLVLSQTFATTNSGPTVHRSFSPNSRLRLADRFHENHNSVPVSTSRFISTSHFNSQNGPIVSENAYTYLSSTVHTPVKRYVPTPPLSTEIYADMPLVIQQQSSPLPLSRVVSKTSSSHQHLSHLEQHQHSQHSTNVANILPYPFQMRCCSSEFQQSDQQQEQISHTQGHSNDAHIDKTAACQYYTSSPRIRVPYKYTSSGNVSTIAPNPSSTIQGQSTAKGKHEQPLSNVSLASAMPSTSILCSSLNSSSVVASASLGNTGVICNHQENTLRLSKNNSNEFVSHTPSIEFINASLSTNENDVTGSRISPQSVFSNIDSTVSNTGTCLHCNTIRRTTGVHQTTQTTGPISPVPLQHLPNQSLSNNSASVNASTELKQSALISESHPSAFSPLTTLQQQQQKYHQQKNDQDKVSALLSKECYEYQLHVYQQQQRHKQNNLLTGTQNNLLNSQQQQPNIDQENRPTTPQLSEHFCHQQPLQPSQNLHQSLPMQQQLHLHHRNSCKQRISQYIKREIAKFFGIDIQSESEEYAKWIGRQRRLALRRFGALRPEREIGCSSGNNEYSCYINDAGNEVSSHRCMCSGHAAYHYQHHGSDRPDILPAQDAESNDAQINGRKNGNNRRRNYTNTDFHIGDYVERKVSVLSIFISGLTYIIQRLNKHQLQQRRQWSRSFAPAHIEILNDGLSSSDVCEGLAALQDDEVFFDSPASEPNNVCDMATTASATSTSPANDVRNIVNVNAKIIQNQRQLYMGERPHGWRTSAIIANVHSESLAAPLQQQQHLAAISAQQQYNQHQLPYKQHRSDIRGNRITSKVLDGVLENSRRPLTSQVKLFSTKDLDDRHDHRPLFTYWINTVQILVLFLSLICYGIGPIGFGVELKTGQVLVTSLSLQMVQYQEQRNVWIGPRNNDLVHMGAKFGTCMRRDTKIIDVLGKTRRKERETACCIRNDDSGCVQSSQADCSVRGLFPTSVSTWKKWSPGESGPGGRISGSVCGLDPKYCDAPASIAPYEWPDDITKWPICRKTNSFSQRFRYKDYTAEHMVCEVIGHPCCTGVFGECRITTKEYCDFVNGYFHEEASLCSQISCLSNICGMIPFFSIEVPDQFYRLLTSLCLHAGIIHLAITITFHQIFLADLERLLGPIRTAIVYIGSGLAGNITSAVLVPYKPEVGPLASLSGVLASLAALLILMHWKQLYNPYVALLKLIFVGCVIFCIGTLPWQSNFAGILAGIICGIFLTVGLTPFVGFTKYARKAKV